MYLTEIFKSLQGESSFTGKPCVFIRFSGCNLRCQWCDTEYSFHGGKAWTQAEVLARVAQLQPAPGLVEITGGEPLLQASEAVALMQALLDQGHTVLLETSGSRSLRAVPAAVHKIVDVKCPASGEASSFLMENLQSLGKNDEVKFVVASRADFDFACNFYRSNGLQQIAGEVIFSPAFRKDAAGRRTVENCLLDPRELAEWMLAEGLEARLGLQVHKFLWEPQIQGV
jgi:7-carboxy-7-deazaguanine synthase